MNLFVFVTVILAITVLYSLYRDSKYVWYFAYGINTNNDNFLQRMPRAENQRIACLENYRFRWYQHADIEPKEKSKVFGVLWRIPAEDMQVLDEYEEDYERTTVTVITKRCIRAETYFMKNKEEKKPKKNYVKLVREGYRENGVPIRQLKK